MDSKALEQTLRNLPAIGALVKDRPYRQVWRFEHEGRAFFLKFYPREGLRARLRKILRGSSAMREFLRLQWMQKARVSAPRAVAVLMGFRLDDRVGDAVILEAVEPAEILDQRLARLQLTGQRINEHRAMVDQVIEAVSALGAAKLGHSDLHLGNFLEKGDTLYLIDAHAVRRGGLRMDDVMMLAHSAAPWATTSDLLRGWRRLGFDEPMPRINKVSRKLWRSFAKRAFLEDRYFGRIASTGWSGHFVKMAKHPQRWSLASRLEITRADWEAAWPRLLDQIAGGQLEVLKDTPSGQVLAGEVILAGRPVPVIVKRPRRRYWHRYISEIGRGARARRAWSKAWKLAVRNIPTAWPLIMMEKRTLGYATDGIIVFERIAGRSLADTDLDALSVVERDGLLHRVGRTLRQLEQSGLYLYDAKAENWIIRPDEVTGLMPMIIDVDGLRPLPMPGGNFPRLLRSVREFVQFRPEDEIALRRGYRPREAGRSVKR